MSPRRRRGGSDPVPVGEALAAVGAELGLPDPDVVTTLRRRWVEVLGEDLAPHVHLQSVRDGVARLTVDDPSRATRLRYLATDLLDAIDAIVGAGTVVRVHVTVVARPR